MGEKLCVQSASHSDLALLTLTNPDTPIRLNNNLSWPHMADLTEKEETTTEFLSIC